MYNNINIIKVDEPTKEQLTSYTNLKSSFISVPVAIEWSELIRQSTKTDIEIMVLEIESDGTLVGVATIMRLKKLRAYKYISSTLTKIIETSSILQKIFPNFDIGFLEVPISNYSGLFTSEQTTQNERNIILEKIVDFCKINFSMDAFCIKEDSPNVEESIPKNFNKLSFIPNSSLDIRDKSFEEFIGSLTKKKRRKFRIDRSMLEKEGGSIELIDNPSLISDELYQLYLKTNLRKELKDDYIPTPLSIGKEFFDNLSHFKLLNTKALVAKVDCKIIGYCLLMQDGETLYFKSVGLDYDLSFKTNAYFNLFYSTIEYGIEQGFKRIDYGITSYIFKKRMGCELHDSSYFIVFYNLLLDKFGSIAIKLLDKKFASLKF